MKRNHPVIVRLQGGLGNQLYEYAVGRSLSLRKGAPLLLDTRPIRLEAPQRHYDLAAFKIHERHVRFLTKWCVRWACSIRLGRTFRVACPLAWNYRILQDRAAGFDASIFNEHNGPIVLQGYWQSFKYFEPHKELIRQEFSIKEQPDAMYRGIAARLREVAAVAVHVRRGDYMTNAQNNALLGTCDPDYYQRASELMHQKVKNAHFFVFTDDSEWARANLKLPNAVEVVEHNLAAPVVVLMPRQFYDPAWARPNLKQPSPMEVVEHNLGRRNYEDLWLMSQCSHFIIANSSFSWWGAWLADGVQKTVIAPKRWFTIDKCPGEDRIPPEWIRV